MDLKKLGKLLKQKREEKNLSLREASQKIGISHSHLRKIEMALNPDTGQPIKPSINYLEKMCALYEMDLGEVLQLAGYAIDLDNLYGISRDELPDALTDLGVEYVALAKEIKDSGLPIDKIKQVIKFLTED